MKRISLLFLLLVFFSCSTNKINFDASGSFESEETIISSQETGILKEFNIEEGQIINESQYVGYIDSTQLFLKKKQLIAQINALSGKKPDITKQIASLNEQLIATEKDQKRFSNLVTAGAAPSKQLDDINSQIEILKKQIDAQKSSLGISITGLSKDIIPLEVQIEQVNDQLSKCKIINPKQGTILTKFAEVNEMTTIGKPLYKIANLSDMILRVYITGNQLAQIKLNQIVKVLTDDGNGNYIETPGTIIGVNSKAEFTPKTIQTKDERANTVYAIKIKVKNDGQYKIGMYGEIKLK